MYCIIIIVFAFMLDQTFQEATGPPIRVCPLYAGLPAAKQLQVWKDAPAGTRKIILATNIAEASVTIPRIKCVIDTGVVKERYIIYLYIRSIYLYYHLVHCS